MHVKEAVIKDCAKRWRFVCGNRDPRPPAMGCGGVSCVVHYVLGKYRVKYWFMLHMVGYLKEPVMLRSGTMDSTVYL